MDALNNKVNTVDEAVAELIATLLKLRPLKQALIDLIDTVITDAVEKAVNDAVESAVDTAVTDAIDNYDPTEHGNFDGAVDDRVDSRIEQALSDYDATESTVFQDAVKEHVDAAIKSGDFVDAVCQEMANRAFVAARR